MALQVELSYPGLGKLVLHTKDISESGVFLYCSDATRPPVNTEAVLRLTGSLDGEAPPSVRIRVARVTDEGIGVEFLEP